MKKLFTLLLIAALTFGCVSTNQKISDEELCQKIWRYRLDCALSYALTNSELEKIRDLALNLKGNNLVESSWNTLSWVDGNIKYNWEKASLPPPVVKIWHNGKVEVVSGFDNKYQTPSETLLLKEGICGDYAILTAGLLLAMNYTPIYVFNITFAGDDVNHVAAAIKIGEEFFILDQHLPVLDLGSYYKKWAFYESKSRHIDHAVVYELRLSDGKTTVSEVGRIDGNDFVKFDYRIEKSDLKEIEEGLKKLVRENYPHLREDLRIKHLDELQQLPYGYKDGKFWVLKMHGYAEFYNPVFKEQFIELFYGHVTGSEQIHKDMKSYNRFYLRVEFEDSDLAVYLNLARK